jgi:membrane protein implicated in regulation of membrane protease activity
LTSRSFVGWRGIVVGIACVVLGAWAVVYTCNTETAACKGVVPWPGGAGFMNRTGWVAVVAGIVLIIVVVVAWVIRAARERRDTASGSQRSDQD